MTKTPLLSKESTVIDWKEIHHRLETVHASLEERVVRSPEEKKKIMQARAKKLAREPQQKTAAEETLEVVEFVLAYETYAVESSYVREVYPMREFTPLPGTPPFVLGIVNVRGQILSVIDIKKFFDLPEKGLTDLNKVIILKRDGMEFGILADVILGVFRIPNQTIKTSLPTLTGIRADYLLGVTHDRMVILDAEKLLTDRNMLIHDEGEIGS